jgi:coatomer subunit beta'
MYLLGYIPKDNRLYLGDKELNIVSYSLLVSVLEYQTAVMRRDFSMADKVLPTIPKEQRTRVAHFLEKQVRVFFLTPSPLFLFLFFKTSNFKEC